MFVQVGREEKGAGRGKNGEMDKESDSHLDCKFVLTFDLDLDKMKQNTLFTLVDMLMQYEIVSVNIFQAV